MNLLLADYYRTCSINSCGGGGGGGGGGEE